MGECNAPPLFLTHTEGTMKNKKQVLIGLETEKNFIDFIENLGFKGIKVGAAYDMHQHFDVNISAICSSLSLVYENCGKTYYISTLNWSLSDNLEVRNAKNVIVKTNKMIKFKVLYDKNWGLQQKIKIEQLRRETS